MPSYDVAIVELLHRAATTGNLRRISVLDPHASDVCRRYSSIVQRVHMMALEGLPEGTNKLYELL